jgi:hypothetical protein
VWTTYSWPRVVLREQPLTDMTVTVSTFGPWSAWLLARAESLPPIGCCCRSSGQVAEAPLTCMQRRPCRLLAVCFQGAVHGTAQVNAVWRSAGGRSGCRHSGVRTGAELLRRADRASGAGLLVMIGVSADQDCNELQCLL